MKGGQVRHVYNFAGVQRTLVSSLEKLAPGRHTVQYEFVYDGGAPGSGGISRLRVDGVTVTTHKPWPWPLSSACTPSWPIASLGQGTLAGRTGDRAKAEAHLATATMMYREMGMGFGWRRRRRW